MKNTHKYTVIGQTIFCQTTKHSNWGGQHNSMTMPPFVYCIATNEQGAINIADALNEIESIQNKSIPSTN